MVKISKEVKIGAVTLFSMIFFFFIFNYLKGKNLFSKNRRFYAIYNDVSGLAPSKGVFLNGFQVGRVDNIFFHPKNDGRLIVEISIDKEFELSNQTKIQIYEDGLIKGAAVKLILSENGSLAKSGDTLIGVASASMVDTILKEVAPLKNQVQKATKNLDETLIAVQKLMDEENTKNIKQILKNVNDMVLTVKLTASSAIQTSDSVNELVAENSKKVSALLDNTNLLIGTTEKTMKTINGKVENLNIEQTVTSLNGSLDQLHAILAKVNSNEGTMGRIINNPELYDNLTKTSLNLQELIGDLKANPSKYVQISVFGK